MEHKVNEIITYIHEGETIFLEVTPTKDSTCQGCFFNGKCETYWPYVKHIVGSCDKIHRSDNTPVIFTKVIKKIVDSNKQSSDIYKKDVLGKWINIDDINPIKIKDLKPGDYVILRVQYDSIKFDYKLAYVDYIRYGQVKFNIQDINITNTPIKITDFCILPSYTSNNFYKTNK